MSVFKPKPPRAPAPPQDRGNPGAFAPAAAQPDLDLGDFDVLNGPAIPASNAGRNEPAMTVAQHQPPSPALARKNTGSALPTLLSPGAAPSGVRLASLGDFSSGASSQGGLEGKTDGSRLRLVAGRVIPGTRYRIVRWLGEGGMGVVYEVENIDIEKSFALKVLRFDLSREAHIASIFRDEARAASRIGSPYIVDITNFGELSDGRLFFCMEMLAGHDLTPDTANPRIDVATMVGYLRQICKGLGAAHDAGIVHRDIKPENIFVYEQEGRERIKLLDFGIAAMHGGRDASGGTPHYMAPEQIMSLEFDGRLDMYALGCTAYELLIGQTPFDDADVDALFAQHLEQEVPSFSSIDPDHQIPEEIERVIARCLAKRPEDRYANMAELEAAICEAQIECGLLTAWDDLALPEIDPERKEKLAERMPASNRYLGRRRWLWPTIALVSTGVAVSLAYALSERPVTDSERDQVDELVARAQNAGARTWYVYPPESDPKAETSYLAVLALENLDGPMGSLGEEAATELRDQFAKTLIGVGDRYWDVPGARMFARDFYTQAVFFDPDSTIAGDRSGVTPAQLFELKKQAAKREFRPQLLASVQMVNDLADPDFDRRKAKLGYRQQIRTNSSMSQGLLAQAIRVSEQVKALPAAPRTSKHRSALSPQQIARIEAKALKRRPSKPAPQPQKRVVKAPEPAVDKRPQRRKPSPKPPTRSTGRETPAQESDTSVDPLAKTKFNAKKSQNYLRRALEDRKRGRRSSAERNFHLALSHNSRNHRALHGLSEISFDLGGYEKALKYARQAVRYGPKNASYRLQLGDALYKVHRYLEAREAYQEAKRLGARGVSQRLRNIEKKIGRRP